MTQPLHLVDPLALPRMFTYAGKAYQYAPADSLGVVRPFEVWMIQQAWLELKKLKPVMTPGEYREQEDGLRRDITAKALGWGSQHRTTVLQGNEGRAYLMWLMIALYDKDTNIELTERILKDFTPVLDAEGKPVLQPDGTPLTTNAQIVLQMMEGDDPNQKPPAAAQPPAAL